ncbi:MAG: response regulator [Chloroflexota bacterium]
MTTDPQDLPVEREQFEKWVHDALGRLYDTPHLQTHPLASLLLPAPAASGLHRCQALRRSLLEAIQALRPGPGTPAQSPDWRAYRILELRYLEGLGPTEAMKTMALGRSQYFREQARALAVVTTAMWDRWLRMLEAESEAGAEGQGAQDTMARIETERLSSHASWQPIAIPELLGDLQAVVEPLARQKRVSLSLRPLGCLREAHGDRVMLRQAALSLLTVALDVAAGGEVDLADFAEAGRHGLRLRARAGPGGAASPASDGQSLEVCRHLVEAMGGTLRIESLASGLWVAEIAWTTQPARTLLVVDDNQGLIDLFTRYLAGHGWQVSGATSCAEARRILGELRPSAIALDVMMPGEDGWEFLLSLKNEPAIRGVPVIVCSVLRQPQLAQSLGAAAYLPKPVTQQALLEVLALLDQERPSQVPRS